jgi:signal transduction histidine kinase/CheY-like chemotaxis protein
VEKFVKTISYRYFLAPLSGGAALGWSLGWWAIAFGITVAFWKVLEQTPFLMFFPVAGLVAARSGPGYGIATAFIALASVALLRGGLGGITAASAAMVLACMVISLLAYSSRKISRIAEAQQEIIVHDREKLIETERALRAQAENANRMKDEFLATLSHELRTPLNAIVGWSSVLAGNNSSPDVAEAARIIQRNANIQSQLIDDLLDLNRIIAGKLRLELQPVDVSEVINAAIEAAAPQIEQKNLRLTKLIDPKVDLIRGDPARIQQILANLLSNAIKYTLKGGRIGIALERINSHIEISVSDNGKGISPALLPHVFDRFSQAQSDTRREGGLGLGLEICRHLVELHGGTIHAKSPGEGQGSTFRINLPVPVKSEQFENSENRVHPSSAGDGVAWDFPAMQGLSVIVVEDDEDSRTLLVRLLGKTGADVRSAGDAPEALKMLSQRMADLVVSDIGMPGMNGFEFMQRLRSLAGSHAFLSVAVTAFARPEDRRSALLSGYDFFASKPLDPGELSAILARAVERLRV